MTTLMRVILLLAICCFMILAEGNADSQTRMTRKRDYLPGMTKTNSRVEKQKSNVNVHHIKLPGLPNGHKNATVGVKTSGNLLPFGPYGGDCTLNWANGVQVGGGFNTGAGNDGNSKLGIGGGFTVNETSVDIGAGINAFGSSANYHLFILKDGAITITIDADKPFHCNPTTNKKRPGYICSTA